MTAWNVLMGWGRGTVTRVVSLGNSVRNWFHPDAGAWFLYPESLFPVSFHEWYGLRTAPWKYDPATNLLVQQKDEKDEKDAGPYRLGWLSAQTVVSPRQTVVSPRQTVVSPRQTVVSPRTSLETKPETKDMDAFLGSLRIWTVEGSPLPLTVLLQAWSIYDKRWWCVEEGVRLEWIDAVAEENSARVTDDVVVPLISVGARKSAVGGGGEEIPKEKLIGMDGTNKEA